jgi:hypothetical protein
MGMCYLSLHAAGKQEQLNDLNFVLATYCSRFLHSANAANSTAKTTARLMTLGPFRPKARSH